MCLAAFGLLATAPTAHGDGGAIDLMSEPTGYTDVADAFDEGDPFDVNVRLGFRRSTDSATIQREHTDAATSDGRPSRRFVDVAEHSHEYNALELELELGLYRDLMLFAQLPIVLAETRELREPDGVDCVERPAADACQRLTVPLAGGTREVLFDPSPLASAKRSGLPSIDFGLAWGVTNQQRGSLMSTWVLRGELSIPTEDLMEPCTRDTDDCSAGISDGQAHLTLESRWSHRFRHVEPLLGVAHTFSWISGGEDLYRPAGRLDGLADDAPPTTTQLTAGAVVIPWEDRGRHQRFALDTRASAEVISEGRDISPLFDALGVSESAHLQTPNLSNLAAAGADTVPFTGVTRVEGHARISMQTSLVIQAARYVRFNLGLGLAHTSGHLLTGERPCNTKIDVDPDAPGGGLCVDGLPNPAHRPVIDAPGQRFRIGPQLAVDLFATAAGQF